ncbi:MAG TPA: GNAT family N-acetyltransferase [Gaiellaceae bacterium]
MRIREATDADSAAVAAVHEASARTAYRDIFGDHPFRAPDWAEILGSARVIVAEEDEEIVGFAVLRPAELDGPLRRASHWGRGVGSLLLADATERLSDYDELTLWVLAKNDRARRFYERHGWAPDGAEKDSHYGELELRYRKSAGGSA